jgi:hypothetical protein
MASFIINTKAELWKCRKTAAYWLTLLASVFVPVVSFLMLTSKPEHFAQKLKTDTWRSFMNMNWQPAAAFFLPMYVILVTSLVVQIEYRNNTWKQVYASPRSYADVFFSKFLVIHLLILASVLLFNFFLIASGYAANIVVSGYTFFDTAIPWKDMLIITGKMYASILAVTAIQYWLSLRLRNYIAPVGIGLALLITALMIIEWEKIHIYPYAYTALTYFRNLNKGDQSHQYYSYVWFVGVLLLAFWDTVKRKERG